MIGSERRETPGSKRGDVADQRAGAGAAPASPQSPRAAEDSAAKSRTRAKKQLIIHAGVHRTGTTAIQETLSSNRDEFVKYVSGAIREALSREKA